MYGMEYKIGNAKTIAVLAVLLRASPALAQTFDVQAAEGAAAISRRAKESRHGFDLRGAAFLAPGAAAAYARTIFCAEAPKDSGLPDGLRFYTGLDANPSKTTHADETAARLDDYRSAYIKDGLFHYDAWSCDTQDYWFSFDVESLLKDSPSEANRPVKGHVRIETRGQLDWEGDLDCVANW
jgi:hypothetical protein